MIRATWDTNTLAWGAIAREGVFVALIDLWRRGEFEIVVSDHSLVEVERTLRKPFFQARVSEEERAAFLSLVRRFGTITHITVPIPSVLSERTDNVVLATALSAETPYIVTGDREMQEIGSFQGVRILSPRAFFVLFGSEQ